MVGTAPSVELDVSHISSSGYSQFGAWRIDADLLESVHAGLVEYKIHFLLQQLGQEQGDLAEILDEPLIETCMSKKRVNFPHRGGLDLVLVSSKLTESVSASSYMLELVSASSVPLESNSKRHGQMKPTPSPRANSVPRNQVQNPTSSPAIESNPCVDSDSYIANPCNADSHPSGFFLASKTNSAPRFEHVFDHWLVKRRLSIAHTAHTHPPLFTSIVTSLLFVPRYFSMAFSRSSGHRTRVWVVAVLRAEVDGEQQQDIERVGYAGRVVPALVHLVTTVGADSIFHDLASEDPYKHLKEFHVVCSTMRSQGIPKDYIKMKVLPFSLDGATKDWLYQQLVMFNTWGDMKCMFLEKFFPASRTVTIRKEICGIRQHTGETLHEYWD
ncbi:hypothetical protein CR513_21071, partial [Mucuna pruriens]